MKAISGVHLDLDCSGGCGACDEPITDDWIALSKPTHDAEIVISTIFCSLACWYRFCQKTISHVESSKAEAASVH